MNGPYPEITNISFLAKLFFKTFISLKQLSDCRTIGPLDTTNADLDTTYADLDTTNADLDTTNSD
jgi:hypothetical protein